MEEKINNQINYIKSKWFIITDEKKVRWYLEKVWLHRLKEHFNTVEKYEWTDFKDIINLYILDKSLRSIILLITESIEKSLKSLIILNFDNILDKKIFQNKKQHDYLISKNQKKSEFVNDVFIDSLTFWEIVKTFNALIKENKRKISNYYWIDLYIFENWLIWIKELRNKTSHNSNLMNLNIEHTLNVNEIIKLNCINKNKQLPIYLIILDIFRKILIPNYNWDEKLIKKLNSYDKYLTQVGFIVKINNDSIMENNKIELSKWMKIIDELFWKYVNIK